MATVFLRYACGRCGDVVERLFDDVVADLRAGGAFRREAAPTLDVVVALLQGNSPLPCNVCGERRGEWQVVDRDEGWSSRECVDCGLPIDPERLEVFPDVERCARCAAAPNGARPKRPSADELCPRCGGLLTSALRSTGRARYIERCGDCGWKST